MINIVGGVYNEICMHPRREQIFGSGGRAAVAITLMGCEATLHSYMSNKFYNSFVRWIHYSNGKLTIDRYKTLDEPVFRYAHGLESISPPRDITYQNPIAINSDIVLRFGMLECDCIVNSNYAVYDPQNTFNPTNFSENGSVAKHLALILNSYEAYVLSESERDKDVYEVIKSISKKENAEVVVVKMGPKGAIVYENDKFYLTPAFQTGKVSKIGSGDNFSAHFIYNWAYLKKNATESAYEASKATAYYCEHSFFGTPDLLLDYNPTAVTLSDSFDASKLTVYVAGPFFTLSQLWIVEQACQNLREIGFNVFSPYHNVGMHDNYHIISEQDLAGLKKSDIIFVIGDGLDSGTIFELGYAHSKQKPIIFYSENIQPSDLVMMHSPDITLCDDYVTAIYNVLWRATSL